MRTPFTTSLWCGTLCAVLLCTAAGCSTGGRRIAAQVEVIAPPLDQPAPAAADAAPSPAPATAASPAPAPAQASAPTTAADAAPTPPPAVHTADAAPPQPSPAAAPAAPAPAAVPAPTRVPELPRVIYFDVDAYKVEDRYRPMLRAHAQRLRAMPGRRLLIRAYTDPQGPVEYNEALSSKRAETVKKMLIAFGAPADRLHDVGAGERSRSSTSGTGAGHWSDRRVELIYR